MYHTLQTPSKSPSQSTKTKLSKTDNPKPYIFIFAMEYLSMQIQQAIELGKMEAI